MKKNNFFAKACFFIFIFLVSIISCEIGLGGAVDTQPPSVTIDGPEVDSIIRDKFAIYGEWEDDVTIAGISVTLKRTDGKGSPATIEGSFEPYEGSQEKGSWKAIVNYEEQNLIDGTYQAIVTVKDKGRHESSQSTTFTIDNTPPILVLSRPGTTVTSTDFDTYGKKITLEGKATDDNNVGLIELSVYKDEECSGEAIAVAELKNVPLTVETDVTKEGEAKYEAIYLKDDTDEKDEKGTAYRYFKIKVFDDAKRFPTDPSTASEDDGKGNCANYYYTDEGLAKAIEAAEKITTLYHIQNGTVETDNEDIIQGLRDKKIETGKFSVNPRNNPTFIVNSRNPFNPQKYENMEDPLAGSDFQVTTGNSYLEVEVSPGLDKKPIDVSTVAVALVECDNKGEYTEESPKIYLINSGNHTEAGTYEDVKISKTGTSYKFKTSKQIGKSTYSGLNTGKYYRVLVDGKDVAGNDIICDENYSFKLVASGEKIELSGHIIPEYISQDSEAWVGSHSKLTVELNWNGGEPPYDIYRGEEVTPITVTSPTNVNGEEQWLTREEFNFTKLQGLSFPSTLSYKMKKAGDVISTTAIINLKYDSEKPSISNIGFKDNFEDKDAYYYNETNKKYYVRNSSDAKFEISGIATDDTGIESVSLAVPGLDPVTINNESRFKFQNIDFSALSGEVTATITATDLAGNKYPTQINICFDTTAPYSFDQIDSSSKNLRIRLGTSNNDDIDSTNPLWNDNLDKDVGGKYGKGTFGNTTTLQLRGDIKDDGSGLAKIYYKVYPDEHRIPKKGEAGHEGETNEAYNARVKSYLDELKEQVIAEKKIITPLETPEIKRVFYNVSGTDPYDGEELSGTSKYYKEVEATFKDNITGLHQGNNYLVLVAEDKVGNTGVISTPVNFEGEEEDFINYSINIDTTPPSDITNKTKTTGGIIFTNGSDMPVLWGTVSDKATGVAAAGIKSFTLSRDGIDKELEADFILINTASDEDLENFVEGLNITTDQLTELKKKAGHISALAPDANPDPTLVIWKQDIKGTELLPSESTTVSISATAKDASGPGNTTPAVIATITVDKTAPTITVESPSDADTDVEGIQVNGIITKLSGTSDDENGIGSVVGLYYKTYEDTDPVPVKPEDNTVIPDSGKDGWYKVSADASGETNWKIENINTQKLDGSNPIADGTKLCFTVAVKDKAGNIGYSDALPLVVNQDTDRPVIKMNQVKSDGSGYLTSKTVFGSIKDDDGNINKLWVWSKKHNNNVEPSQAPSTSDNGQTWTLPTVPTDSAGWIEFGSAGTDSTLENNNWQIESKETDGETNWFWAVADANNKVFWTKSGVTESLPAGTPLTQPYIIYSDKPKQKYEKTSGITFKYDTESPEINSVELLRLATDTYKNVQQQIRYAASEIAEYVANMNLEWDSANNIVFGKDYALMYAKIEVTEKTGMNENPVLLDYIPLTNENIYAVEDPEHNKYTYYLGPFDLSQNQTVAPLTLKFTAKDEAKRTALKEKIITVDNEANITISNVSPSKDEITSGKFSYGGQVSDAESTVTKVEYYIPKHSEKTALAAAATDEAKKNLLNGKEFMQIAKATSIQWSITFNNFNTDVLGYTATGTEVTVNEDFADYNIGEYIYKVPVWFKVTDSVGNIGYVTDNEITYDPNEDRPKVYISDPEMQDGEPVEKGGRIKISGTAQDNEGVEAVYLQFKVDKVENGEIVENGEWTNSAEDGAIKIPGTNEYGFIAKNTKNWNYTYDVSDKNLYSDGTIVQIRAIAEDNDTSLLSAWTEILKIKVNNTIPYLEGDMYLRQYDTDGTSLLVEKKYEPNIYIKGDWILEGRFTTASSNYLSELTINVNNGESKTSVWERTNEHEGSIKGNNDANVEVSFVDTKDTSLDFKIPITGSATCKVTIEATDGSNHTGSESPEINIDNTAPSFADYTDINAHKVVLYQDSYGAGGTQLGSDHFIQNSNGAQFTLAGKIVEDQSGFDKAIVYFTRTGSSDGFVRVYNPMEGHGTNNLENRTNIAANRGSVSEEKPIFINDDKLPVRPLTVERTSTETAQNDEIKTNKNIRVGGLVNIGGLYRLITEVNRTSGTITFEPETNETYTSAEFVYGLVIDHNGERDNGSGGVDFDDGDGLLESYSGSTTANYRWEATFNSANIPDGPIDIYVVTFDKAGNIGWGYLETKASNNAPRITKVLFGTDLNGNNVYDYGTDEFNTFYAFKDDYGYANTKKGNAAWTLNTSVENGNYWTVKKGMAVIPEFVGGAGPFYYVFEKSVVAPDTELSDYIKTSPTTFVYSDNPANNPVLLDSGANSLIKTGGAGGSNATWTYGTSTSGSNTGGSLTLNNEALVAGTGEYAKAANGTETNPVVVYTFSFWDSTEESTPGRDTGSTILNAYVRQDLQDDVVPNSVIKPFEWKGTGYTKATNSIVNGINQLPVGETLDSLGPNDVLGSITTTETQDGITTESTITITPNNSLYGASITNGHIELENDLPDSLKTMTAGNPAEAFGADPKVSGKITFHGTSYDNTRLSSIWFKFDNFTASNGKEGGDTGKEGTGGYCQAAYYNSSSASWEPAMATMAADGWEFVVTDTYFNQSGHKVDWYLSIDTNKITGVTGLNKKLTVISLDSSSKVSLTSASTESVLATNDVEYNKPVYQMDVVPYIAKIYTSLATLKKNNWSVYNRTAQGHYPVASNETIYLYGFNLGDSTYKPKYGGTELAAPVNGSITNLGTEETPKATEYYSGASYASYSVVSFPVSNMTTSGVLNLTVNSVPNLNNYNKTDAKGSFTGTTSNITGNKAIYDNYYNRQPNGDNNNLLKDDVELDIWEINTEAGKPKSGKLLEPVMSINPVNHKMEFAFVNGSLFFSMGSGVDKNKHSYEYWIGGIDFWTNIDFVHDKYGHTFGTVTGGDINEGKADQFRIMSGRWGKGTKKYTGYNDGNNQLRLEMIAQREFLDTEKGVNTGNKVLGYNNFNKLRIHTPSIATTATSTSQTNVYLAYYDEINDEIRFRHGVFKDTKDNSKNGLFNDYMGLGSSVNSKVVNSDFGTYGLENVSLIAGQTTKKLTAKEYIKKSLGNYESTFQEVYEVTNKVITEDDEEIFAGSFVDIAAISQAGDIIEGETHDDAVIAVWWDETNQQLLYSYNLKPNSIAANTYKQEDTHWSKPKAIFGNNNGIGKYCKIVVDNNNKVHVVAYDSFNGDVCYAYISDFKHPENAKTCIVDSYGIIGTELNIDVALNSNNESVPYISYYAGSNVRPKLAYLINTDALTANTSLESTEDDAFTGVWEVGIIPTLSIVPEDHINVGVWKDSNGIINYSTTDGTAPKADKSNIGNTTFSPGVGETEESYGEVYGNGSKNPVLAYAITKGANGYIETAQMK